MKAADNRDENGRDLLSSLAEDDTVRPLLVSLRSLSHDTAPALSPELAAMLEANASATVDRARWSHRRTVIFSLALIAALGTGAGAAAAAVSPEFRSGAVHAIGSLLNANPFVPHTVENSVPPSRPPAPMRTPGSPAPGGGITHPAPAPSGQPPERGNGTSRTDKPTPRSTNHPTPPAKGHGNRVP